MTEDQAKKLAEAYISENMRSFDSEGGYVVYGDPDEDEEGWYFHYQTARYVRTNDINDSVVGNSPIFITKQGACLGPRRPPALGGARRVSPD